MAERQTGHVPHPYGNCDACGDPTRLLDELAAQGERLGVELKAEPFNSWDMAISLGARTVAQLVLALRQASQAPTQAEADALLLELVDGIESIGG
jgi:hypothetical protein